MELVEIERRLGELIRRTGHLLPPGQKEEMLELVGAGEPGIALENYCTQIFEYDIGLPVHVVRELQHLGNAMGIEARYWTMLRLVP